jgi:hypothetical protein
MAELTAEQKLAYLKLKLLEEIRSNERQILCVIKQGAKNQIKLIRDKFVNGMPDKIELTKEEYQPLLDYLNCVSNNEINKLKGSEYANPYYSDNRIKTEILNQL